MGQDDESDPGLALSGDLLEVASVGAARPLWGWVGVPFADVALRGPFGQGAQCVLEALCGGSVVEQVTGWCRVAVWHFEELGHADAGAVAPAHQDASGLAFRVLRGGRCGGRPG